MNTTYEIIDFQTDVLERSKSIPVLVDFWADWCGPCKVLGPVLERLAAQSSDRWVLAKVDTEAHQDLAAQFGIRSIPNVKLFSDGVVVDEFTGALPEPAITRWLEKALPDRYRHAIDRAESLLLAGNSSEAEATLREILNREPRHERARVILARTKIWSDPEAARALVEEIEEHSEQFPMADAIRMIALLLRQGSNVDALPEGSAREHYATALRALAAGDFSSALSEFIEVVREDREYEEDGARKACIAIFRMLGEHHEITKQFRREFSSALYR
jgi:putative thioredoxin